MTTNLEKSQNEMPKTIDYHSVSHNFLKGIHSTVSTENSFEKDTRVLFSSLPQNSATHNPTLCSNATTFERGGLLQAAEPNFFSR